MTLAESLQSRLANWKVSSRTTLSEAFPNSGWTIQITAERSDAIAMEAWEVVLTRNAEIPAPASVQDWAKSIASRATGLLERLKLLETDAVRDEAILRSDSPTQKGDRVAYYEVHLVGTHTASVRRYQADRKQGTPREQVPFALTHEVLAKLVGDVTNA